MEKTCWRKKYKEKFGENSCAAPPSSTCLVQSSTFSDPANTSLTPQIGNVLFQSSPVQSAMLKAGFLKNIYVLNAFFDPSPQRQPQECAELPSRSTKHIRA